MQKARQTLLDAFSLQKHIDKINSAETPHETNEIKKECRHLNIYIICAKEFLRKINC